MFYAICMKFLMRFEGYNDENVQHLLPFGDIFFRKLKKIRKEVKNENFEHSHSA